MIDRGGAPAPVPFATLALGVSGAGVLFLGLTTLAVALVPLPPAGRAVLALVGVALTIAAMGLVSRRITDRAIRAEYGDGTGGPAAAHPGESPGPAEGDEKRRSSDGLG